MSCSLANTYFEMRTQSGEVIEFNFAETEVGFIVYMESEFTRQNGEKAKKLSFVSRYESFDPRVGKEVKRRLYKMGTFGSMRTFIKYDFYSANSEFVYPTAEAAKADFDIIALKNGWVANA